MSDCDCILRVLLTIIVSYISRFTALFAREHQKLTTYSFFEPYPDVAH